MHLRTNLLFVLSALLLTMCRSYAVQELSDPIVGLDCRSLNQGLECNYTCPDGTVITFNYEDDPSLSATKGDLDRQFCGITPQVTPTEPPAGPSPTPMATPTILTLATVTASPTPTAQPQLPLLTGSAPMCDLGGSLINFRIAEPVPDLTGRTLDVRIQDQASACYVNAVNPSLLTCSLPGDIVFPASVVVSLDGAVVNDFVYDGIGCAILTTPTPLPDVNG